MNISENIWLKFIETFRKNKDQLQFGSYAAEISFYIIWAIIPMLLAIANVIAILPIQDDQVIAFIESGIPEEVRELLLPILKSFLKNASGGIFSLGLIISLWQASNIFNTIQRVFNQIYKVKAWENILIARLFAYLFTVFMVVLIFLITSLMAFGDKMLSVLGQYFPDIIGLISQILEQAGLIGVFFIFIFLISMYHYIPNVKWPFKYSLPGSIFAFLGFFLISQLFQLYVAFSGNSISNQALGVFLILMIWVYFNSMVVTIGAYLNVFVYDYIHHQLPE